MRLPGWLRKRIEPAPNLETASQDAPGSTIAREPVPDDLRLAVAKLQGDWAEMQLQWAETLDKLQAWANRQSARDRKAAGKALDRLAAEEEQQLVPQAAPTPDIAPSPADVKAELRQRVARMRGMA